MQNKLSFTAGSATVIVAVAALSAVSGLTTFTGLTVLLSSWWVVLLGAVGIQGAMFGLLLILHGGSFLQKLLGTIGYVGLMSLSATFSFVGLDGTLHTHINRVREKQFARAEFEEARDALDTHAHKIRAAALEQTNSDILSSQLELERWQIEVRNPRLHATRRFIAAEKVRELQGILNTLEKRRRKVEEYHPDFGRVTVDKDIDVAYAMLQEERDKLAEVWSLMPASFRQQHLLPPMPARRTLMEDGTLREGQDHPFVETLKNLRQPDAVDKLALAIAIAFDIAPLLVLWLLSKKGEPLNQRIHKRRLAMARIGEETKAMEGVVRWFFGCFYQAFFARA